MTHITIGKTESDIEELRTMLSIFKFETVDSDGDIEFISSEFGFTWIRDCGDTVEYPDDNGSCHYWTTLAEAMNHSNESNYGGREEFDAQVAEFQAFMDDEVTA